MRKALTSLLACLAAVVFALSGWGLWRLCQTREAAAHALTQADLQRRHNAQAEREGADAAGRLNVRKGAAAAGDAALLAARDGLFYYECLEWVIETETLPPGAAMLDNRALLPAALQSVYDEMYAVLRAGGNSLAVPPYTQLALETVSGVFWGILYDDPALFWFNGTVTGTYDSGGLQSGTAVMRRGRAAAQAEARLQDMARQVRPLLAWALTLPSDVARVTLVHDFLAQTVAYDLYAPSPHRADGALVDRRAVCEGIALAFKYCMNRLNIPSAVISGTSMNQNHAWNAVCIDGAYYNLDATWDAPGEGPGGPALRDFFLLSDAVFDETHRRDAGSQRLPACADTRFDDIRPGLAA